MRGRDPETGEFYSPSRTRQREEALEVRGLAEKLVALPPAQLLRLPIPEALLPHIHETRRITSHIAHKRQLQYLAKQMRREDDEVLAAIRDAMQRDGWYSTGLAEADLEDPAAIGRRAAERTVARLQPRSVATGEYPVLFAAEMARSLIGHLLGAVSGGALYRKASFLLDHAGKQVFPDWFAIDERPHLSHGLRSAAFDAEGVATRGSALVEGGVLQRYVLGSYSARKLGLQTTANAGGVHNLAVKANAGGFDELVRGMGRGLLVTELMGQGVNPVTGDYSRGAAGFWVEDGAIAHPLDEITVAGNLKDVFARIEAVGIDVDRRSHIGVGSILVGRMTVAGAE